ncbi:SDR family oxidoreductase [Actinoplanes oblitus]|uniref:SDR family oxidoreductase n=1 Tax=Actinoplanes oblitus TaxID=3040509 RepID=A0ABY8WPU5_9ACTN|nr:SDR family oxidoreductase [Actinoplanes oblitus]WIM99880.1 SDR family oxidoreductase [Actinoplanes oblitus]
MITSSRLAVVSGGATGIGREVARRFAEHGDRVVIIGRRANLLHRASDEINRAVASDRVVPINADLADPVQVQRAADQIVELGNVDVLVNNAGAIITPPASEGLDALAASWRHDLDVNLITAVLLTNALMDHLRRPGGRLIMVSSAAAQRGAPARTQPGRMRRRRRRCTDGHSDWPGNSAKRALR